MEKAAIESSTAVAPLYRQLKKEGFDAGVSRSTKLIAKTKIKSESVDSKAIVKLPMMEWWPLSYVSVVNVLWVECVAILHLFGVGG